MRLLLSRDRQGAVSPKWLSTLVTGLYAGDAPDLG
jgi:hypothetical protein